MKNMFGNNGVSVLQFVSTVQIPGTNGEFVAKEKFPASLNGGANGEICFAGGNFKNLFLCGKGKVEKRIFGHTLCIHKLLQPSLDRLIITELLNSAVQQKQRPPLLKSIS